MAHTMFFVLNNTESKIGSSSIYTLSKVSAITNFVSYVWTLNYNEVGDFELVVPYSSDNMEAIQPGYFLVRSDDLIDATKETYRSAMIIEKKEISYSLDGGWTIKASGRSAESILARRVIWGNMEMTGDVKSILALVINRNAIDSDLCESERIIKYAKLETFDLARDSYDTVKTEANGDTVSEWLHTFCDAYGIGWSVEITLNNASNVIYTIRLYDGTTRTREGASNGGQAPVVFAPSFNNLSSFEYAFDKTAYKTAAYVKGEERTAEQTGMEALKTNDKGIERRETYVDGSGTNANGKIITDENYQTLLKNAGKEKLLDYKESESYDADILNNTYKINEDYFLGDIVEIDSEMGFSQTVRIKTITYSEDENGQKITPQFEAV